MKTAKAKNNAPQCFSDVQKGFLESLAAMILANMTFYRRNQCRFAKLVKVGAGKVGAWLRCEAKPSRAEVKRLDQHLGCLGLLLRHYCGAFQVQPRSNHKRDMVPFVPDLESMEL